VNRLFGPPRTKIITNGRICHTRNSDFKVRHGGGVIRRVMHWGRRSHHLQAWGGFRKRREEKIMIAAKGIRYTLIIMETWDFRAIEESREYEV
jgi:hypothetical protein